MPNPQQNQSGIRIAGDFKLNSVQLRPYNGALPLDLTNVREEINIYEDIYSNFITGDIGIWDTWDLTQLFPLIGEETLILSFNRPGTKPQGNSVGGGLAAAAMETVKETEDYTMEFRVVKLTERTLLKDKKQFYRLHFCSPELIVNKKQKIRKAYKKKLYSDIVADIYATFLNRGKPIEIEATQFEQDYCVTCQTPAQALNIIACRSIAAGRMGSNYIFFQTFDGFRFTTIEKLFEQEVKEVILYQHHNIYASQANRKIDQDVRNVNDYEFADYFDVLENINAGLYASKLLTYDLVRKRYFEYDFDYNAMFDKVAHLAENKICTAGLDALGAPFLDRFSFVATNKEHDVIPWIADREPNIMPTHIEEYLQIRHSQMKQIDNHKITLTMPGNSVRRAGDLLDFALPNVMSDVPFHAAERERYLSGKYLITAIRHRIEINGYFNDIEMVKDSFVDAITYDDPIAIYNNVY